VRLALLSIGKLKAGPERELTSRYVDRARASGRNVGVSGLDVREFDESKARRPEDRKLEEARTIIASASPAARMVLLDERGKSISSRAFAQDIAAARDSGTAEYLIVIGGPDGVDDLARARAQSIIAFGAMTWPHQLIRIMAAEQIYRALTILAGHPYHRV
jgi:23S rRNA (pseudouridine1915-N3)-methyltransferase